MHCALCTAYPWTPAPGRFLALRSLSSPGGSLAPRRRGEAGVQLGGRLPLTPRARHAGVLGV